jgi:hypothetical protein
MLTLRRREAIRVMRGRTQDAAAKHLRERISDDNDNDNDDENV